jgi:hypothetical protein
MNIKPIVLVILFLLPSIAFSQDSKCNLSSSFNFPDSIDTILIIRCQQNIESNSTACVNRDTLAQYVKKNQAIYSRLINGIGRIYDQGLQLKLTCGEYGLIAIIEFKSKWSFYKIVAEVVPCPIVDNKVVGYEIGRTWFKFTDTDSFHNLELKKDLKYYIDSLFTVEKRINVKEKAKFAK